MKTILTASTVAALLAVSGAAFAQSAPAPVTASAPAAAPTPEHSFSGEMRFTSEYRYRGISQSNFKPAVQGEFDYAHSSGFYLGTWASNISWISDANPGTTAPIEIDFYGGYKGEIVKDLGYDVGVLQYYFPGSHMPSSSPNTTELYASLSYGMFTGKYSYALTNLFGNTGSSGGGTKGSSYVEAEVAYPTGWYDVNLKAHAGYQHVKHTGGNCSYADWKVGADKGLGQGFKVSLYYVGTNAKIGCYSNLDNKNLGRGSVLASLVKNF